MQQDVSHCHHSKTMPEQRVLFSDVVPAEVVGPEGPIAKHNWTAAKTNLRIFGCRHTEGATPILHPPDCRSEGRGQLQPPRLRGPPGRTWATSASRHGRRPPATPWALWTKPSPSRTSSKTSSPTSTRRPSAGACRSLRQSGRPGFPTRLRRGLGLGARCAARVALRCRRSCLRGAPSLPPLATDLCPDSGNLRGHRPQTWGPCRPSPRSGDQRGCNKRTRRCTPATWAGGDRKASTPTCRLKRTSFNKHLELFDMLMVWVSMLASK